MYEQNGISHIRDDRETGLLDHLARTVCNYLTESFTEISIFIERFGQIITYTVSGKFRYALYGISRTMLLDFFIGKAGTFVYLCI